MSYLKINPEKINAGNLAGIVSLCPFGALSGENGVLSIGAGCRMCKLCVKKSDGAVTFVEEAVEQIDKSAWRGVSVYAELREGKIHPVTLELLGKARELAGKIGHPVYAVLAGTGIEEAAHTLLAYGADRVYVYDEPELADFIPDLYANVLEDFIDRAKPCALLVGATNNGRSLAPRAAARFKTGLTADCTSLEIKENTDLVQIRPAFGGNIMAQIVTPNSRPQFCTVRYKIFSAPKKGEERGEILRPRLPREKLTVSSEVLSVVRKALEVDISDADVIVAVGRGLKSAKDIPMIERLASLLGAQVASTRPLIECGWFGPKKQIGLSGRTVKPKLILTLGISGSVQFAAGMKGSDRIIAVNTDRNAPIMDIAHDAIVGDLYDIVPKLIADIAAERG